MKMRAMGLMMLAGYAVNANAEGITAAKKSGGQQVSDNLYGDVETRLTSWRFFDANGNSQTTRDLALRPKLGTKIMNERLDLNLTLPMVNKQRSSLTEQQRPEALADFTVMESERLDVSLNTTNFMQTQDKAYEGYVDLDITAKRKFDNLEAADINLSCMLELESALATQRQDADIISRQRSDGAALTQDDKIDNEKPEQKQTTKGIYVYPKVSVAPKAIPGVSFALASYMGAAFTPKYTQELDPATGETSLKDAGYKVERVTQNRYTVNYKVNDQVTVYNQLRQNMSGYQQARYLGKSSPEIENRTGVTVTLF